MIKGNRQTSKGLRHEIKLLLPYAEYLRLSHIFRRILNYDEFAGADGEYFIRSMYLDDVYETAYTTKISGVDNRKKYRIRCYNYNDDVIKFECKNKYKDRINKVSFKIDHNEYFKYMNDDYDFLSLKTHPLAKEIYGLALSTTLKPSVIVDYNREAYVHPLSNTRLTFDKHLRAAFGTYDIFDQSLETIPVFENNSVIFEIKYDNYIPSFIMDIIASARGTKMSLSKFCMCRQLIIKNNIIF